MNSSRSARMGARQLGAVIVSALTALAISSNDAANAASTTQSATAEPADTSCPAVQMLLGPGTSETARTEDPNVDNHGFLSNEVVKPIMDAANVGSIADLGAGFSDLLEIPGKGNDNKLDTRQSTTSPRESSSSSGVDPIQRIGRTYVTYPSTAGGFWAGMGVNPSLPKNFGDTTSYADSVATGVSMTEKLMSDITVRCPETSLFLAGYSQGAEVMSNVARRAGAGEGPVAAEKISGVALFADPTRTGGTPLQPDGSSSPGDVPGADNDSVSEAVSGLDEMTTPEADGLSTDKSGFSTFGDLSDRVVSWCLMGDYVCGLPADSDVTKDIVSVLEDVSAADPVKTLEQLGNVLDRAVSVGNLSEIADFSYGDGGFDTENPESVETPVLADRVAVQQSDAPDSAAGGENTPAETSSVPSASETAESDPAVPAEQPGAEATSSTQAPEPATPTEQPTETGRQAPHPGLPALPELPQMPADPVGDAIAGAQQFGAQLSEKIVPVAAGLGGMALGAGITVAKQTLTPENIAQIGMAGVTGGPQAAGTVAVAKLSDSAMSLLEPGTASGYARETLQLLKDNDIAVADEVEMAVNLSAWMSLTEHVAYGERAMLPDGRSAAEATTNWVEAIAADLTADSDTPMDTSHLSGLVTDGLSAVSDVDFDPELARTAVDTLTSAAAQMGKEGEDQ